MISRRAAENIYIQTIECDALRDIYKETKSLLAEAKEIIFSKNQEIEKLEAYGKDMKYAFEKQSLLTGDAENRILIERKMRIAAVRVGRFKLIIIPVALVGGFLIGKAVTK